MPPPVAVHTHLQSLVSIHVVLSTIDRHVNFKNKGKGREEPTPTDSVPSPVPEESDVDRTPADGVSDLVPAPTPEGLVPSSHLPSEPAPPRVLYNLPDSIGIEDCAIFYLGGESLALNNLLMTHGKCQVS
jgi:diphthamide biosynthesis protein 2